MNKYIRLLDEAKTAIGKDDIPSAIALGREFVRRTPRERMHLYGEDFYKWKAMLEYGDFCTRMLKLSDEVQDAALALGDERAKIPWEERYVQ